MIAMRLKQLFPHFTRLRVDGLTSDDRGIALTVHATRRSALCLLCDRRSARVHVPLLAQPRRPPELAQRAVPALAASLGGSGTGIEVEVESVSQPTRIE